MKWEDLMSILLRRHQPPSLPIERSKELERSREGRNLVGFFAYLPWTWLCFHEALRSVLTKDSPWQKIRDILCGEVKYMGVESVTSKPALLCPGHMVSQDAVRIHESTLWGPQWSPVDHRQQTQRRCNKYIAFSKVAVLVLIPYSSIPFRALPSHVTWRIWNP